MKRVVLFFVVIVLLSGPAHAADAPLTRAMKFYKTHHYEKAIRLQRFIQNVRPEEKGKVYLSLGIFFLSDSALHGEFHEASLAVNLDYLRKVSLFKGKDRSRMVNLYLAETLLEAGRSKKAAFYFGKVLKDRKVGPGHKAVAKAGLGLAFYLQGQRQKALGAWSGLKGTNDPEVLSELAFAYSRAGLKGRDPKGMCERALGLMKKKGKASIRVIKNAVGVYARAGRMQEGLDLLWEADLKAPSHEEVLGKNKVIWFYDPALLGSLSLLYAKASVYYLKKAGETSGVADLARYYLGEAYLRLGLAEKSAASSRAVVSSAQAPGRLKALAEVRGAAALYQKGRKTEAVRRLAGLSEKHAQDPLMLAEVLLACGALGADCKEIVSRAASLAEAGQGRKFARLNHALGRYYLGRKNYEQAISYMEAGRDKSNKNRIESNDPAMLVHLAVAYANTKKFSEALDIFFEMSKHFPGVRQIQAALQGIYSVEQKSAGDVKVL